MFRAFAAAGSVRNVPHDVRRSRVRHIYNNQCLLIGIFNKSGVFASVWRTQTGRTFGSARNDAGCSERCRCRSAVPARSHARGVLHRVTGAHAHSGRLRVFRQTAVISAAAKEAEHATIDRHVGCYVCVSVCERGGHRRRRHVDALH